MFYYVMFQMVSDARVNMWACTYTHTNYAVGKVTTLTKIVFLFRIFRLISYTS